LGSTTESCHKQTINNQQQQSTTTTTTMIKCTCDAARQDCRR